VNKQNKIDYNYKVLEVKNLKQYFKTGVGSRKLVVKAVDGISFDVYKREVFGLVGESGCGKTTTGRSIIKIYNPTNGIVKYNGRIVGVGLQGVVEEIKKLKRERYIKIIQHNPFKKKIFELKSKSQEKINVLLDEIKKIEGQANNEIIAVKSKQNEYNNLLELAIHKYETKANEVKAIQKNKIDRLTEKDIKDIIRTYNRTILSIEHKLKDKVRYIKSLPLSKEEKVEKEKEILATHEDNLKIAQDKLIKSIESIDPSLLKVYEEEIHSKNSINYVPNVDLKSESLKTQIAEIQAKYGQILAEYKAEHDKEVSDINAEKPDKTVLKETINKIKANAALKVEKLSDEIKGIKKETAEKINEIKKHAKENPNLYPINKNEIIKIKKEYKKIIQKAKNKLRTYRFYNKLKETPEEKSVRLQKINDLKAAYYEKIKGLSPEEVKREKAVLDAEISKLNANIPCYNNTMSKMQMVFQDPIASLNPRMIVKDIISESLIVRGEHNQDLINEKVNKILDIVGLSPDHATRYPHEFSGGQRQRIGIARALISDPDFIIADEPISALDVSIQAQILNLLNDLKNQLGLTILFIAHDLSVVKYFCDRIAVMYYGKIVELASSEELFKNPLHPYTKSLISAIPQADPIYEATRVRVHYNPAMHDYKIDKPELVEITPGHFIYANKAELKVYKEQLELNKE